MRPVRLTGNSGGVGERQVSVRWEGAQFSWHSLGLVNREFCLGLLNSGRVDLSLVPTEPNQFQPDPTTPLGRLAQRCFAPLAGPADVHIRHFFPPRLTRPKEGKLVLIQPWEYGYLPQEWINPIRDDVHEVWCYSHYIREMYVASGISVDKLRVVPLGADTEVYRPEAPPHIFTTEAGAQALLPNGAPRFVFLFVGGTLHRKGIDILLKAYFQAFSAADDVCLVIKDTGTETVYRGQNERERILGEVQDPSRPALVYLEDDLSVHQMAGLYTAAHCLVQPYRGEGFCLPALEAMACGRPVIVPEGGPTDDFVDEAVGWRVPAERLPFGEGRIGPWDCAGPTWMFEVASDVLAQTMRDIFDGSVDVVRSGSVKAVQSGSESEVFKRGAAAAVRVRENWTWQHSCRAALERLQALQQLPSTTQLSTEQPSTEQPSTARPSVGSETLRDLKGRGDRRSFSDPSEVVSLAERPPIKISLCMIVRDEERVLGDCLRSVRPWVDEIILVDTGSCDQTVKIAEAFGARVFHSPWRDDFSAARNVSLSHATGDWILWMDADDTLPEKSGCRLHDLAFLAEERVTGFLMQVHIPPAPGEAGFTVVDHVKLFRNLPGLRFEGRIHEQILEPIHRLGGSVERSDLYVVHSGYDYSPEGQQRKRARDLLLLQKDLQERPNHPFVLFNIGMTAFHMKDYAKAVPALEQCLSLCQPRESIVRKVYAMLAGCWLAQGEVFQAKERIEQGLRLFPQDPELLFRAGVIYQAAQDFAAAERSYLRLLTEREVGHIDSLDVSIAGFKAHHNLALTYQEMQQWDQAEAQWRAAVDAAPEFVPSLVGLGELLLRLGRWDEVRGVTERLSSLSQEEADQLETRLREFSSKNTLD